MSENKLYHISNLLHTMKHDALKNYIVPGLTSSIVGGGEYGKIRVFEANRSAKDFITPHSHRFDFACLVLQGEVRNTIYYREEGKYPNATAEKWCLSTIDQVCGLDGLLSYAHVRSDEPTFWKYETLTYTAGDVYKMTHAQIHSIQFEKNTQVLFFEGPQKVTTSEMLEPWENGKVVPTFKTEDWMFEK